MAQNQCGKCGEMVDAAKAFCPGCGNSFVDEEQREASGFEKMDSTVQLGQTMYNQMLTDMGLSVDKGTSSQEKRIEIIAPAAPAATPVKKPDHSSSGIDTGKSKKSWLIFAAVAVAIVLLLGLLAAAAIVYYFWPRIG